MRILLLLCGLLGALPLWAQDRAGNDTPGEWIVDHYRSYGLWDSICDHRETDGTKVERCYIRYVEVFSPRPNFAAQFIFVTPGPEVEIGLELGTQFAESGMRIEKSGAVTWTTDRFDCRFGLACTFKGDEATTLINAMANGSVFAFDFKDRNGDAQSLRWDLAQFSDAVLDFRAAAKRRGL